MVTIFTGIFQNMYDCTRMNFDEKYHFHIEAQNFSNDLRNCDILVSKKSEPVVNVNIMRYEIRIN